MKSIYNFNFFLTIKGFSNNNNNYYLSLGIKSLTKKKIFLFDL